MQDEEEMDIIDPYCIENQPQKITFEDITSAAFKIKSGIIKTPCVVSIFKFRIFKLSISLN